MWWEGPQWLSDGNPTIPKQPEILQWNEVKKELVRSQILTIDSVTIREPLGEKNDPLNDQNTEQSNHQIDQLFPVECYGSLDKTIRVAKQVLKFAYILLEKPIERKKFERQALNLLVRDVQKQNYFDEIEKLQKSQSISRESFNFILHRSGKSFKGWWTSSSSRLLELIFQNSINFALQKSSFESNRTWQSSGSVTFRRKRNSCSYAPEVLDNSSENADKVYDWKLHHMFSV